MINNEQNPEHHLNGPHIRRKVRSVVCAPPWSLPEWNQDVRSEGSFLLVLAAPLIVSPQKSPGNSGFCSPPLVLGLFPLTVGFDTRLAYLISQRLLLTLCL